MATFNVTNSAELNSAIQNASGGDTILLASGTYDGLDLNGVNYASGVTIKSSDPNNLAVIGKTEIDNSSNITFDNIHFKFAASSVGKTTPLIRTDDSSNITVKNSLLEGAKDSGGYGLGTGASIGGGSVNVVLDNNEIFSVHYGIATGKSTGLKVTNNEIYNFSADGIQMIGVTDMLIEGNYLHDAMKPSSSGVHQDFIQLFSRDISPPTTNLTIRDNIMDVGDGNVPQGIFLGNEAISDYGLGADHYYSNIVVEGNVLYGARYHGIMVAETDGIIVRNNTLLQIPGQDLVGPASTFVGSEYAPAIKIKQASTDVVIEGNVAREIPENNASDWVITGNVEVKLSDYSTLFTSTSLNAGTPHEWVVKTGSVIDGVGSNLLVNASGADAGGNGTGGSTVTGTETGTGGTDTGSGTSGSNDSGSGNSGSNNSGTNDADITPEDAALYISALESLFGPPVSQSGSPLSEQSSDGGTSLQALTADELMAVAALDDADLEAKEPIIEAPIPLLTKAETEARENAAADMLEEEASHVASVLDLWF